MRRPVRVALVGLFCVGAAAGAVFLVLSAIDPDRQSSHRPRQSSSSSQGATASVSRPAPREDEDPRRKSDAIFLDQDKFEDGGFGMASQYTGSIQDSPITPRTARGDSGEGASRARGVAGRVRPSPRRSPNTHGATGSGRPALL